MFRWVWKTEVCGDSAATAKFLGALRWWAAAVAKITHMNGAWVIHYPITLREYNEQTRS